MKNMNRSTLTTLTLKKNKKDSIIENKKKKICFRKLKKIQSKIEV